MTGADKPARADHVRRCQRPIRPGGPPCNEAIVWVEFSRECSRCKGAGKEPKADNATCSKCRGDGREHVRLPVNARRARHYAIVDYPHNGETALGSDLGQTFVSHFLTCRGMDPRGGKR